jgi:hypothetical protein
MNVDINYLPQKRSRYPDCVHFNQLICEKKEYYNITIYYEVFLVL